MRRVKRASHVGPDRHLVTREPECSRWSCGLLMENKGLLWETCCPPLSIIDYRTSSELPYTTPIHEPRPETATTPTVVFIPIAQDC